MDDLDPILIQVTIPLPIPMIYTGLVDPAQLTQWLATAAIVEPKLGGKYHLVFDGDPKFTSPGRITHYTQDVDIGYTWYAPPAFAALMNEPEPTTHVYVRLQESPEGIDVTFEHNGWKGGDDWEEARSWHFHFWDDRLQLFKAHLLRVAYG
ncbi:MAG: SRPBCC domain-containing protein [Thermoplasmata archaeon]|nr:SRPBCC domain-containing protein [Thermoplasmata archaeon]